MVNFDLEYQTLSMQIFNEACVYILVLKQLHEYHFKKQLEIEKTDHMKSPHKVQSSQEENLPLPTPRETSPNPHIIQAKAGEFLA